MTSAALATIMHRAKPIGSTHAVHALAVIHQSGKLTMTAVANACGITTSAVTCMADSLEKQGLIERVFSPTDRRAIHLTLTKSGTAKVEQILQTA